MMRTQIVLGIALLLGVSGCSVFKSNAQNIADAAKQVEKPACDQVSQSLNATERAQVYEHLTTCAQSFAPTQ
jgi:hypothetical protein